MDVVCSGFGSTPCPKQKCFPKTEVAKQEAMAAEVATEEWENKQTKKSASGLETRLSTHLNFAFYSAHQTLIENAVAARSETLRPQYSWGCEICTFCAEAALSKQL